MGTEKIWRRREKSHQTDSEDYHVTTSDFAINIRSAKPYLEKSLSFRQFRCLNNHGNIAAALSLSSLVFIVQSQQLGSTDTLIDVEMSFQVLGGWFLHSENTHSADPSFSQVSCSNVPKKISV